MLETRHHWLPVILAVYFILTCFLTYSIAVGNKDVEPGFPYISDTGTIPPARRVFGQLLNVGAVIGGIIIYIRYRHVFLHFENIPGRRGLLHLNTAAFILGTLTVFGVSLVGNFQGTNVLVVHLLGAFLAFAVGFFYCVLQTIITHKVAGVADIPGNDVCIRRTRITLCVVYFFLSILLIMTVVAGAQGPGTDIPLYKWSSDHPGYAEHVVATVSEWLIAFITVIYLATFYTEFKHFRVRPPKLEYYDPNVFKENKSRFQSHSKSKELQ